MPSDLDPSNTAVSGPLALDKVYEPQRFEPHWAEWWIDSKIYRVEAHSAQPGHTFSLVIPPPNVTGSLHIGHMLDHTTMDVAVRWHRMLGETTLWLPGMDHAGIATQMVVERQLAAEGLNRKQLGREEFERRVWQWKDEYGGRIVHQIRREGASVDWSRERFTMDAGLSRAVREAFVRLWERGLIYRGEYMVNWCPDCQTAISDVETIHEAVEGHLWYIRYPIAGSGESLTVATTRPETMLGDTALMVYPDDARYRHLQGKTAVLPLLGREIPIIADSMVDAKFGTGVVKVTPAHDPNDFDAGKRHGLAFIKVIGEDARMTAAAGAYAGLNRFEARKRIVAALEESGELVKIEPYTVNLSKCDRSKTIIEPLISTQWFVKMKPLAEKAIAAVKSGRIRFVPDDREVVFFQWMENIRDWCVSRQLWWGHRIPAWHCRKCRHIMVARETPAACSKCHSTEVEQDTDVLDTWFSSGLWPFSTLGWPDDTEDLRTFYPTTLLITGFDILFFWVSRMITLGLQMTGDVPFREVHMHGLVRDSERQKMSKTKGNVINPLEIIDKYGTDALRVALLISASPGADIALKMERVESERGFANKLWNASRLLFMNMERSGIASWNPGEAAIRSRATEDIWMAARLRQAIEVVNSALKVHRYQEAALTLRDLVWREFCDWYIEAKKLRFETGSGLDEHWRAALSIYETMLRLLHPVMPFITEELWQRLVHGAGVNPDQPKSISLAAYPADFESVVDEEAIRRFELLREVVTAARTLRADHKLDPKSALDATLYTHTMALKIDELQAISAIVKVNVAQQSGSIDRKAGVIRSTPDFDLQIHAVAAITNGQGPETRARIEKENAGLQKNIENSNRQLNDPVFLGKAPAKIVEGMRAKLADYEAQLEKNRKLLEGLG
ncbi:MAG TPA: valine--tRNA ligase [Bryobacteraceae bacterium]|nr:valine--tRNA ligase [Bryobacteraceae bacterium]